MTSKNCVICTEVKNLEDFHRDSSRPDGRYPYCKPCRKEFCKVSYYDNPRRQRERALKTNYGLSFNDFETMAVQQGFSCLICKAQFKEKFYALEHREIHVDHCHKTGDVRGILCRACNHVIGSAKENPEILTSAIAYLARTQRRVAS